MKFAVRSIVILVVSIVLGFSLYYTIQAIPEGVLGLGPQDGREHINNEQGIQPGFQRPEGNEHEGDRRDSINVFRLILGTGKNFVLVSIGVVFSFFGSKILFGKRITSMFMVTKR